MSSRRCASEEDREKTLGIASFFYHSRVDEHTITRPARPSRRIRPGRRRTHGPLERSHLIRPVDDVNALSDARTSERNVPQMDGGGSSGRGPVDDDGGRRRPDRDGDNARRFLIALGILAVGAGVMSARVLARARH